MGQSWPVICHVFLSWGFVREGNVGSGVTSSLTLSTVQGRVSLQSYD